MTNIDQFESVFRSAAKDRFEYEPVRISHVLVIADKDDSATAAFAEHARSCVRTIAAAEGVTWREVSGAAFEGPSDLLKIVEAEEPHLICTYRNLHSDAWRYPYSLGESLDLLTQHTPVPILVLPHPDSDYTFSPGSGSNHEVMAVTNHLAGDDRLINFAVALTEPEGTLFLAHIEDDAYFARIVDAISKIPQIQSDEAEEQIREQLLKGARDYIASCREVLEEVGLPIKIEEIVAMGHRLSEYKRYIDEHEIDLLVIHSKDEDQVAMHGLAFAVANELRQTPLLMI